MPKCKPIKTSIIVCFVYNKYWYVYIIYGTLLRRLYCYYSPRALSPHVHHIIYSIFEQTKNVMGCTAAAAVSRNNVVLYLDCTGVRDDARMLGPRRKRRRVRSLRRARQEPQKRYGSRNYTKNTTMNMNMSKKSNVKVPARSRSGGAAAAGQSSSSRVNREKSPTRLLACCSTAQHVVVVVATNEARLSCCGWW